MGWRFISTHRPTHDSSRNILKSVETLSSELCWYLRFCRCICVYADVRWMRCWPLCLHLYKTRVIKWKTLTRKTSWRSKVWWDDSFTYCKVKQPTSSTWYVDTWLCYWLLWVMSISCSLCVCSCHHFVHVAYVDGMQIWTKYSLSPHWSSGKDPWGDRVAPGSETLWWPVLLWHEAAGGKKCSPESIFLEAASFIECYTLIVVACDDWGECVTCYLDLKFIENFSANNLLTYEQVTETEVMERVLNTSRMTVLIEMMELIKLTILLR